MADIEVQQVTAATRGTGTGGLYQPATVTIDPTTRRDASTFREAAGGQRGPVSPWREQLVNLVACVNMRDADGKRAVDLGEFVLIGAFQSKYGARNRMRKYTEPGHRSMHQPVVEGCKFEFRWEQRTTLLADGRTTVGSELWAALLLRDETPVGVAHDAALN